MIEETETKECKGLLRNKNRETLNTVSGLMELGEIEMKKLTPCGRLYLLVAGVGASAICLLPMLAIGVSLTEMTDGWSLPLSVLAAPIIGFVGVYYSLTEGKKVKKK